NMRPWTRVIWLVAFLLATAPAQAQSPDPYLDWVRSQAAQMRKADPLSQEALRQKLAHALGLDTPLAKDLQPKVLTTVQGDGFQVEKVTFQTFPGVRMPGLLYLPEKPGKYPAVLNVHGHWPGAKQDPVVQARCAALARAGFVALAVDALGAGERGVERALGEYHGGMTGAGLLPVGLPLCGAQILENSQALTYLQSRPEVDGDKLGVTGASGGGNQTMYIAAWDKRLKAAVPVCSVGNYQAYLGAACCMCEVVPGALSFTEEDGLLALTAPRALMVISASRDARQFSPEEARKSIAAARKVYAQLGSDKALVHQVFESGHDYSKPMREAMVGFMRLHLAGQGDGSPVPEADFKPFPREELRCFPADAASPEGWISVPRFAQKIGLQALASNPLPADGVDDSWRKRKIQALQKVLALPGDDHEHDSPEPVLSQSADPLTWHPEKGVTLTAAIHPASGAAPAVILLHPEGAAAARKHPLFKALADAGAWVITADLRGQARQGDAIGSAPDHNTAEWSLWLGRPLLGQWTLDVRSLAEAIVSSGATGRNGGVRVVGVGSMGVAALTAAAQCERIRGVAAFRAPVSLLSEKPISGQRLGLLAPRLLVEVGDIPHLAALPEKGRVVLAGGVDGQDRDLALDDLKKNFQGAGPRELLPATPEAQNAIVHAILHGS
ncbi:MAG: alpha/beta hydrolase family protein, partial [Gemmataceae bacterium]